MTKANLPQKILFVDDDPGIGKNLSTSLNRYGIKLHPAEQLDTALYLFNQNRFDVAVIELEFGPLAGLAMIQKWRKHEVQEKRITGFILSTAQSRSGQTDALLKELGNIELIQKPISDAQLLPMLSRALATKKKALAFQEITVNAHSLVQRTGDINKGIEVIESRKSELGLPGQLALVDMYEKAGRQEEALKLLESLHKENPNDLSIVNAMAKISMQLGKNDEAMNFFERADKLAPMNIERVENMAELYLQMKNPDASVEKFRELLRMHPDQPDLKFKFYEDLYRHGYGDHAVKFGKETSKPMEIVRYYNNKGVSLSKNGKVDNALQEYTRALSFYPTFKENYRIFFNIALAHMSKKDKASYIEAEKNLQRCLSMKPDFEKAQKNLQQVNRALYPKKQDAS